MIFQDLLFVCKQNASLIFRDFIEDILNAFEAKLSEHVFNEVIKFLGFIFANKEDIDNFSNFW